MQAFEHEGYWYICGRVKDVTSHYISSKLGGDGPKRYTANGWLTPENKWGLNPRDAICFQTREDAEDYLYEFKMDIPNP